MAGNLTPREKLVDMLVALVTRWLCGEARQSQHTELVQGQLHSCRPYLL